MEAIHPVRVIMNNDEEMRYLWTIPPHYAKEGVHILVEFEHIQQHNDNDLEEGELQISQNPVNPVNQVTENIVPQWESSQWFSSARYEYTHSGAFLDMGSDSPIDDLVESGTIR
ncbi:hypothetical protein M9H77_03815 [Catharanthus roseus]|uniref:Uncharacterized protein n=1 Tax=Catharanthus roseus TaxID=4058 RepID=A0ACC0CCK4_CATRO|nr:hypothetical protein M9H77_03815 [Catharanthus roseus]